MMGGKIFFARRKGGCCTAGKGIMYLNERSRMRGKKTATVRGETRYSNQKKHSQAYLKVIILRGSEHFLGGV